MRVLYPKEPTGLPNQPTPDRARVSSRHSGASPSVHSTPLSPARRGEPHSPLPCPRTGHTYRRVSPSTLLRPDNACPLEACQPHVKHMSLPAGLHNLFRSAAQSAGAGPLLHRKRLLLRYLTPRRNWAYPCPPTALWLMRLLHLSAWTSWQASFPWPARLCPPASPASPLPSRRGTRPACSRFARRPNQTLPCAPK